MIIPSSQDSGSQISVNPRAKPSWKHTMMVADYLAIGCWPHFRVNTLQLTYINFHGLAGWGSKSAGLPACLVDLSCS